LNRWLSLACVPQDGTQVLFWVPDYETHPFDEGRIVSGRYDAPLDYYVDASGDEIDPICWMRAMPGPKGPNDIYFERPGE